MATRGETTENHFCRRREYDRTAVWFWTIEVPKYYIRSNVLGGETLTEVNSTGKKVKTHVIAAGAKIAEQKQYYGTTTTQQVFFENWDAAGISRRTVTATGTAFLWDGGEESPAELDPMGGNMGLSTPYVEIYEPPPPSEEFPFFPMLEDDSMIVNGQRVTCSLDGFAIGCSQAQGMLNNGTAVIDYGTAAVWSNSQNRFVGFARWDSNAAAAGVGIGTGGLHGLNNNGQNTGWVWMGQTYSTQGGVGGVSMGGIWYSLGDYGHSNYHAINPFASLAQSRFDSRALTKNEMKKMEDVLKKRFDPKTEAGAKCLDFINRTLKALPDAYSTNFMTIFEKIRNDNGYYVNPSAGHSQGESHVGSKPPNVTFGGGEEVYLDAMTIVEETLHVAGKTQKYTHYDIAIAMVAAARTLGDHSDRIYKEILNPAAALTPELEASRNAYSASQMRRYMSAYCK